MKRSKSEMTVDTQLSSQTKKRRRTVPQNRIIRELARLPDNAIPLSRTVKLRYVSWVPLNGGASGASVSYEFRANDVYDPDLTGSGHQPMGFDQMAALYDHFTVLGSTCKVSFAPFATGTNAIPPMIGLRLADTSGTTSSRQIEELVEQGVNDQYMQVGAATNQLTMWKSNRLFGVFDAAKFFRRSRVALIGDSNFQGSPSGSPTEIAVWSIWCCGLGGNDPAEIQVLVELEYEVTFSERKTIAQS